MEILIFSLVFSDLTLMKHAQPRLTANAFWKRFLKKHWEKQPLVVPNMAAVGAIHFDPEQVFEAVLRFTESAKRGRGLEKCRAFVNGREMDVDKDIVAFLPNKKDGSFESYNKRISEKGSKYGIIINQLQSFDRKLWESACRQFRPFLSTIGLPKSTWEIVLFIGNYERTVFGIHKDSAGGFHFPIAGKKKIRTWTSEYTSKHGNLKFAKQYDKHLKNSVLLESGLGGMLYWPSDRWHIGESTGSFSVSMAFPFYLGAFGSAGDGESYLETYFKDLTIKPVQREGNLFRIPFEKGPINASKYLNSIEKEFLVYKNMIVSKKAERVFREKALNHLTSYGFKLAPPIPPRTTLSLDKLVRTDSAFHFAYLPDLENENSFLISCKGHSISVKNFPQAPQLIKALNTGKTFRVRDLVERFASAKYGAKQVRKVIYSLHQLGGLEAL